MHEPFFRTVFGDIPVSKLGLILPHEHLFTDLRGPDAPDYAQSDPKLVETIMGPYLERAQEAGVSALVECSTMGVGRNIDVLRKLAERTRIHLVAPTGIYKEAYTPGIYKDQSIDEMAELWILEITEAIGMSDSKAGFIKIALSDDGPRPIEVRNIRAAARASKETGAAIASHTIGGKAAMEEMSILADEGLELEKFIWVHANSEPDNDYHLETAYQGAYVEFDSIGQPNTNPDVVASAVRTLWEKGYGDRVLLSHDAGWFQPGRPDGTPEHGIRGFTALIEDFIPYLKDQGFKEKDIQLLTMENPKRAFAMTYK